MQPDKKTSTKSKKLVLPQPPPPAKMASPPTVVAANCPRAFACMVLQVLEVPLNMSTFE
jgi:hypothetical protein